MEKIESRTEELLTEEFLFNYPDFPDHMNEIGKFVYYRTYSRYLPEHKRRETWKETCRRSVEYNFGLSVKHYRSIGYEVPVDDLQKKAQKMFHNQFNLKQFLSGRTLWVGGADGNVADKYPLSNFNCSFVSIEDYDDLGDLFYLLLVGTGVGYRSTKQSAKNMPSIRDNVKIIHEPYVQRYPLVKESKTNVYIINDGGKAVIHVGDSKEGWVESLRQFFNILTKDEYSGVKEIGIFYDYIRPKGSRLRTFGGTASGYEPLMEMFQGIEKVINNELDKTLAPLKRDGKNKVKLRPIHILDIGNLIGSNVVVGGKL